MDPNNPGGLFLFLAVAGSLAVVLGLRRFSPDRPRLALLLAVLFGPAGHLYLKGAGRYIALMYLAWAGLIVFTPLPPTVSGLLLAVLSGLLMNVRLRAAHTAKYGKRDPEQGGSS
jgi:hypothetical protein